MVPAPISRGRLKHWEGRGTLKTLGKFFFGEQPKTWGKLVLGITSNLAVFSGDTKNIGKTHFWGTAKNFGKNHFLLVFHIVRKIGVESFQWKLKTFYETLTKSPLFPILPTKNYFKAVSVSSLKKNRPKNAVHFPRSSCFWLSPKNEFSQFFSVPRKTLLNYW